MADNATGAIWNIKASPRAAGSKRLHRMMSGEVSDEGAVEAVSEVGPGEMVGFDVTPGAYKITIKAREEKSAKPEVDWLYLRTTREIHSYTRQVVGGRRFQFPRCMVANYSFEDTEDGKITHTVEIVALTMAPL